MKEEVRRYKRIFKLQSLIKLRDEVLLRSLQSEVIRLQSENKSLFEYLGKSSYSKLIDYRRINDRIVENIVQQQKISAELEEKRLEFSQSKRRTDILKDKYRALKSEEEKHSMAADSLDSLTLRAAVKQK